MKHRDRVLAAVDRQETDRTPIDFGGTLATTMDPAKLKADFGDRLAFWGGIDTQDILPFRTPAEVGEHVHSTIKTFGKGGGYVLSTVHNIQEQVPPENIVAMFDACLGNRPEGRFETSSAKAVQRRK